MKLNVRIDKNLSHAALAESVETRARFALTRLAPEISSVSISVASQTSGQGGQFLCQASASFVSGGTIHLRCAHTRAQAAVELALDRLRRAALRTMERRSRAPSPDSVPA